MSKDKIICEKKGMFLKLANSPSSYSRISDFSREYTQLIQTAPHLRNTQASPVGIQCFIENKEKEILAVAVLAVDNDECGVEMSYFFVKSKERRKGVGYFFLENLVKYCQHQYSKLAVISITVIEGSDWIKEGGSIRLFTKFGFHPILTMHNYYELVLRD